jgi:hypothetical protein
MISPSPKSSARLNGCASLVFAAGFLAVGIGFIAAGRQLGPQDRVTAQVFRTDPSCGASLVAVARAVAASGNSTTAGPRGNCTVVAATVLAAVNRRNNSFTRTPSYTPVVYLRFPDGTTHDDTLDGLDGRSFVDTVRTGALARAQLFRGTLVRVASGTSTAETTSAPDVNAATDSQMPWVGAGLVVIAGLLTFFGVRGMLRVGGTT